MADTIPHFDMASHKSAAEAGGGDRAEDEGGGREERRGEEKGKAGKGYRGGREGIGEWWSMITQFVSGG